MPQIIVNQSELIVPNLRANYSHFRSEIIETPIDGFSNQMNRKRVAVLKPKLNRSFEHVRECIALTESNRFPGSFGSEIFRTSRRSYFDGFSAVLFAHSSSVGLQEIFYCVSSTECSQHAFNAWVYPVDHLFFK